MAQQTVSIKTYKAPSTSKAAVGFYIDTSSLKDIGKRLRSANPEMAKQLRLRLHGLGDIVATEAASQSSWSTRIPESLKVRVSGFSVKIVANATGTAPDAAPLEHGGVTGAFRHPVFGNTAVWVDQDAQPFLAPSLDAKDGQVEIVAQGIITDTLTKVGLL